MAVTVKLKKKDILLRVTKSEADALVESGKARFADKNEWRRWLIRMEQTNGKIDSRGVHD